MPPPLAAGACTSLLHDHVLHDLETGTDRYALPGAVRDEREQKPSFLPPTPNRLLSSHLRSVDCVRPATPYNPFMVSWYCRLVLSSPEE